MLRNVPGVAMQIKNVAALASRTKSSASLASKDGDDDKDDKEGGENGVAAGEKGKEKEKSSFTDSTDEADMSRMEVRIELSIFCKNKNIKCSDVTNYTRHDRNRSCATLKSRIEWSPVLSALAVKRSYVRNSSTS
jgi:hypothetical protein